MPGLFLWSEPVPADTGPFRFGPELVQVSKTWYDADPVVFGLESAQPMLRPLTSTDVGNSYLVSAVIAGIAGFASYQMATDSSGNPTTVASPVALSGSVAVTLPILSLGALEAPDPSTGRMRAQFLTCQNWIAGGLYETTAVVSSLQGTAVGLVTSTVSGIVTWYWSTAAAVKVGTIVAVDESNPLYNVAGDAITLNTNNKARCPVAVQVYPTYNQLNTGTNYAS